MLMGSPATLGAWGATGALILRCAPFDFAQGRLHDHRNTKRRGAESPGGIPRLRNTTRSSSARCGSSCSSARNDSVTEAERFPFDFAQGRLHDHRNTKRRGAESPGGIPRLRDATWAPQRHPGHKERASPTQTKPSRPLLCRAPRPGPRARNDKWGKTRGWLLFGDEELAIFHALHGLKLDFGFLVMGDVS